MGPWCIPVTINGKKTCLWIPAIPMYRVPFTWPPDPPLDIPRRTWNELVEVLRPEPAPWRWVDLGEDVELDAAVYDVTVLHTAYRLVEGLQDAELADRLKRELLAVAQDRAAVLPFDAPIHVDEGRGGHEDEHTGAAAD